MASSLVRAYLLVYNAALSLGWLTILWPAMRYVASSMERQTLTQGTTPGLYRDLRLPLLIFQTAALLEVLHSMLGWVRSAVMTTLMQVYSRVFVVWALMEGVPGTKDSVGVLVVIYAWAITEVIRYAYYFCSLLQSVPYPLVWCRYTFFFLLYPVGVLGEMLLFFAALPVVKARRQWSLELPNDYNMNFSFYYFLIFSMLLYIPLFPQLYGHMIKQRAKILGQAPTQENQKKTD